MTTKITPEAVKERIAALESAGELSLKEQFYLEALRQLVASVGSYPVAWDGVKVEPLYRHAQLATASEPLAVTDDELNAALQLHRLKVDGHSQLSDAFRAGFRYARRTTPQPAPVSPVCTCPSGDGSLRWPCPVHPGNSPVVPDGMERVATTLEYIGNFAGAAIIRQLAANQQQNAPQNIPEIIPESCTWSFSSYDDHWSGTCGAEWVFNDGGPEENGVKFCPKCGKSVAISATE